MGSYLGLTALVVRDYDEAIGFYLHVLGFELLGDTPLGGGKRWVTVRPRGARETAIPRMAFPVTSGGTGCAGVERSRRIFFRPNATAACRAMAALR